MSTLALHELAVTAGARAAHAAALPLHVASPSARGFPPEQVVPAAIVSLLGTALVLSMALRYRRGRLPVLDRVAAATGRHNGLPPWAALPARIAAPSLIVAGFGFYWDVAWHIDRGRDDGPFSTPAHYPIIFGLVGIALAGLVSVVLDRDPDAPVRLPLGPRSSAGGALLLLCGGIAVLGFPLDDLWHVLFGQDVTLWSPTHIQMIGGASLATIALWLLVEEGRRRGNPAPRPDRPLGSLRDLTRADVRVAGSLLIGLSTLQGEYDYGVPQFAPICQPVLVALAAGIGLVAARIRLGRGGAVYAAVVFCLARLGFAVLIGPVLGRSFLHLPLYLAEALVVETVVAALPRIAPQWLGAVSGLGIGTVGFAAEYAWSQVGMPLPWTAALMPQGVLLATAAGVAGGLVGAALGTALLGETRLLPRAGRPPAGTARAGRAAAVGAFTRTAAWAAPAGLVACVAVLAVVVPVQSRPGWSARLQLQPVAGSGDVQVTASIDPPSAASRTAWAHVLAWQGGDGTWHSRRTGQVIAPLREVAPGVWQARYPVPVGGKWKSFLRLADARHVEAVPVFLPADPAIPAAEVPAASGVTRPFVMDQLLLQREATGGSPALKRIGYAGLGLVALAWIACMALGARRLTRVPVPAGALGVDPYPVEPGRPAGTRTPSAPPSGAAAAAAAPATAAVPGAGQGDEVAR